MAYYRDQRGQPRSVRELVQRVGRSIGATARIPTALDRTPQAPTQSSTLEEEMGSRFPQCRGRSSQLQHRYSPYVPVYGRRASRPNPASSRSPAGKTFIRTIYLLDYEEDSIPRGSARQLMYEEGRVVDFVEFNTAMTPDAVYTAIENIFTNILPTQSDVHGESNYK